MPEGPLGGPRPLSDCKLQVTYWLVNGFPAEPNSENTGNGKMFKTNPQEKIPSMIHGKVDEVVNIDKTAVTVLFETDGNFGIDEREIDFVGDMIEDAGYPISVERKNLKAV